MTPPADLCRFLAACYYEPAPAFAEERLFDSMRSAATAAAPSLADDVRALGNAFEAESHEDLLVDYTRLFLGPVEPLASPYERTWHDSAGDVTKLYEEAGLGIADEFQDLPDHVAAELEFLYLLISRGATDLERRFLGEHLGAWVVPFTQAIGAGSQSDFYRKLAQLTAEFVRIESERCRVEEG